MKIEIDQSGKVEDTGKNTIIAFSNSEFGTIFVSAQSKREIQKIFREIGKKTIFIYRVFAVLIFILIKRHLKKIDQIIIDNEYPGKSAIIKDYLLREIRRVNPDFSRDNISFQCIGKKSKAHYAAYGVAIGRRLPDMSVGSREVLRFVIK